MTLFAARDTLHRARRGFGKRLCLCCSDWLDPDDFDPPEHWDHGPLLVQRYGSMTCNACANDHQVCIHCGSVRPSERMTSHDDGPVCADCVDDYEADCAVEHATARMVESQWRAAQ